MSTFLFPNQPCISSKMIVWRLASFCVHFLLMFLPSTSAKLIFNSYFHTFLIHWKVTEHSASTMFINKELMQSVKGMLIVKFHTVSLDTQRMFSPWNFHHLASDWLSFVQWIFTQLHDLSLLFIFHWRYSFL